MMVHHSLRLNVDMESVYAMFYAKNSRFPLKFKVYEYFKDRGFIVRGGTNYGLDYTIYRASPKLCHSEICAYVVDGTHPRGDSGNNPDNGSLSWQELTTLTRVMPDVMKTLLICYVVPIALKSPESSYVETDASIETINWTSFNRTSMTCLNALCVRPLTATVRRLPALSELSVRENYERHKKASILIIPRSDKKMKREKERRDVKVVRDKRASSQSEKIWRDLSGGRRRARENNPFSFLNFFSESYARLRGWFTGEKKRKRDEGPEQSKPKKKRRRTVEA